MSRTSCLKAISCLTLSILVARIPRLDAQSVATAEVFGRVNDQSGSGIPKAQLKMVQHDTQFTRVTLADSGGQYALTNLPVGPYTLEVTADGFKTYAQSGIILQVGNNISINVKLEVGNVTQTVEVKAAASMIDTKGNSIGQVIDQSRVVDLPLNGRQATQLILLSGAAVTTPATNMTGSKYSYS